MFRYGERRIRNNVESGRLSVRILKGEHLCERDFLLEAVVAEPAQDDRIGVEIAQRHRFGNEPRFAAFRFIVPENVRLQVSFLGIRAGSFVVGNLLSRHQKRGDGVDKGRFPRSDVPGQQRVVAVEVKTPNPPVKGSPIEEFAAVKPHPGATSPHPALPRKRGRV